MRTTGTTSGTRGALRRAGAAIALLAVAVGGPAAVSTARSAGDPWRDAEDVTADREIDLTSDATETVVANDMVVTIDEELTLTGHEVGGDETWSTTDLAVDDRALIDLVGLTTLGDDVIVAGALETPPAGTGALGVTAIDSRTGATRWSGAFPGSTVSTEILAGEGVVLALKPRAIMALDADGRRLWEQEIDGRFRMEAIRDGVAVGVEEGVPFGRDVRTGATRWEGDPIDAQAIHVAGDTLVVDANDLPGADVDRGITQSGYASIDPATGELGWQVMLARPYDLVGFAMVDDLLILARQRNLQAIDVATGTERWSHFHRDLAPDPSTFFATVPVVADGAIHIGVGPNPNTTLRDNGAVLSLTPDGDVRNAITFAGRPTALLTVGDRLVATVGAPAPPQLIAFPTAPIQDPPPPPPEPEPEPEPEEPEEPSVLLGIPSPEEALTAKNAGLAGALLALLLVLVVVPSTLFNKALAERLPDLSKRRGLRSRPDGTRRARSLQQRWAGLALYLVVAAAVYSVLEPSWGPNVATLVAAIGFGIALFVTTMIEFLSYRYLLWRRDGTIRGHPELWFPSLGIAAVCVAGSRLIGFVPGYLYGVVAEFEGERPLDDTWDGRFERNAAIVLLTVATGCWWASGALASLGTSGWSQLPAATTAAIFMAGVETLTIGLLPVAFLPGAALRREHPHWWKILWACSAFLFCLAMLRPGLVSAQSSSARWLAGGAAAYAAIAVTYWWLVRQRDLRASRPLTEPSPPPPPPQNL